MKEVSFTKLTREAFYIGENATLSLRSREAPPVGATGFISVAKERAKSQVSFFFYMFKEDLGLEALNESSLGPLL